MQSGTKKFDKWVLKFLTKDTTINPLMGWESSDDTSAEINLEFETKDLAINYAKKNYIEYDLIEHNERKINIKSYSDNFTK